MQQYLPIFLLQFVLSTIIKIGHPLTKSNVIVAIDDYFLKFTINGVGVDLESFRDLGNWVTIKRFSLYLSEGDELLFEGMNNHDALSNPRGMAIQIEFVKKNGEITVYKTGNGGLAMANLRFKRRIYLRQRTRFNIGKMHFLLTLW